MPLPERKKLILKAVVDNYIETAEPVGSKAVALKLGSAVSSATIRGEMAELETLGYLEQPHTSSGRVPSNAGYRMYVDELMSRYKLTGDDLSEIHSALMLRMGELDKLISEAGKMVSDLTSHTAIAVTPIMPGESVRKFEVIMVDSSTVVLVLVTTSDIIRNKITRLDFPLTEFDVQAATRALNMFFTNIPLEKFDDEAIRRAEYGVGSDISQILAAAIDFAYDVLSGLMKREAYLKGATQILRYPEYRDVNKARELLDYLADRKSLEVLSPPEGGKGLKYVIGAESEAQPMQDASVIVSPYQTGSGAGGLIGVVGPKRMDYAKVSARLTKFTEGLSKILTEKY